MDDNSKDSIFRQESLERLSSPEQLDQLMQIVNPRSWLSLTALGSLVMLAIVWSVFGRIPITATGKGVLVHPTSSSNELIGLTYFDRQQARQIQPGMEVMIIPDGFDRSGILGQVKTVSASPVTTLAAARQVETSNVETGSIEVLVELPATVTAQALLSPGTTTTVRILLDRKAPIAFAFPFLEASQ